MIDKKPKVTVIIPVYNVENYLRECLDSVINQTLTDIEIICVDDGSTDSSIDILNEYRAKDNRIKIICQKNKFAGVARNTGMAAATGEYFAFLDSDDYYVPDGLEKAYEIAKTHNLDMLKLASAVFDSESREVLKRDHYLNSRVMNKNTVISFTQYPKELISVADIAWNGLYKAEFIRESNIQFNNFRCVNDRSFYITCMVKAQRIMVTDVFLTYYRVNLSNSLVSIRHKHFECQTNSARLIKSVLDENNIPAELQKLVMRSELYQLFVWYENFLNKKVNVFYVEEQITEYLQDFDINDVGQDFIDNISYTFRNYFYRFFSRSKINYCTELVENPKVSVIIPSYNVLSYISECLESVLKQTIRDIEIICIDDGSTDATYEMLCDFAERDKRITVIRQANKFAGVARNNGLTHAKGKYITFLDADDKLKSDFVETLYNAAEKNNSDVVVSYRVSWNRNKQDVMKYLMGEKRIQNKNSFSCADMPDYILTITDGAPGAKMFRREFVINEKIEFLSLKRSEDFSFIFESLILASGITFVEYAGYYYRRDNVNSLESTKDDAPLIFWDACQQFKQKLLDRNCYDMMKRAVINSNINRFSYNLKNVKNEYSLKEIYDLLIEVKESELELSSHSGDYFFKNTHLDYVKDVLSYENFEQYLINEIKRRDIYIDPEGPNRDIYSKTKKYEEKSKRRNSMLAFRRKLSSGIQCLKDNGLIYTLKRTKYHFSNISAGRKIKNSFLYRKIKGGIRCLKENGLVYTIKIFFEKIINKLK